MAFNDYIKVSLDFVLDKQYMNLLASTLVLFSVSFLAWFVYYKQLARKDLFEIPELKLNLKSRNFLNRMIYFLKYLIVFPVYSFVWFLVFSFLLLVLSQSRPVEDVLFLGIIVVAATRMGAYVSDKLAEDMAKLLPWTLIALFLIDPKIVDFGGFVDAFSTIVHQIPNVAKYLLFIIVLEWLLRIGNWIFSPSKQKPQ